MYIQTKRLLIRPYEDRDMAAAIEILKNKTVTKTFMVPDYPSEEDYQRLFRRMQEDSRAEDRYAGGIYLDDQLVGLLLDVEVTERSVEVGYALHPDYHNRGFATEVLTAAIEYLFAKGFSEVLAGAFRENAASIRVMEKSGMTRLLRQEEIEYRGAVHTCVYYSVKSAG